MENWDLMIHFIFIGALLFVGKIVKERLPILNKFIIPTALIAGFLGMFLSEGFLGLVNYDREGIISEIIYHGMAIGFIALTLKKHESNVKKKVWSTGMIIVLTYLFQAIIGFFILVLFFPKIFSGAGLLLALGFGQGPGLAHSIGHAWEHAENVILVNGAALGSTFAVVGFLWGGVVGVITLNYLIRKHNIKVKKGRVENNIVKESYEFETTQEFRMFDSLTTQFVIILVIYGFVYLTILGLDQYLLSGLGNIGNTLGGLIRGFNFLFGILYALLFKKILGFFETKGKNVNFLTNNYVLSNISSMAFNFMIAAAVLKITVESIKDYYVMVLVVTTVGGILTLFFINWLVKKVYNKYLYEYFLGLFGMLTGTAATGVALVKSIDRDLESPVAEELVVGSGTALVMAFPLFYLLTLPVEAVIKGNDIYYVYTGIGLVGYFLLLLMILFFINRKK